MGTEDHSNHAGDHKENPEDDRQQLQVEDSPPALLADLLFHPAGVHLLHPQAHGGQDDEVGVPVVGLQGQHHPLGERGHAPGQAEGHMGQPGEDVGVAGQGEGVVPVLQRGEAAAEGAGNRRWAVWDVGLRGEELDSLQALGAKNVVAPEHTGAFVVAVVLLVADGAFHVHGLLVWVLLLKDLDNVPSHGGAVPRRQQRQLTQEKPAKTKQHWQAESLRPPPTPTSLSSARLLL